MFKRILVPLDGSQLAELALKHALHIARLYRSHIVLLSVIEENQPGSEDAVVDPLSWQISKSERELYLQSLASQLVSDRVTTEHVVLEGRCAEGIVQYAQDANTNLVVMTSHGRSGLSRWDISSVTQKVVQKLFLPVLVVRAYQPAEEVSYRRILVPLDGSKRAECSLPASIALAEASHGSLLLASVVQRPELPPAGPLENELREAASRLVQLTREALVPYLNDLKSRYSLPVDTLVLESDSVTRSIHELADREEVDLVVMCAHGASGGAEYPFGSVASNYFQYGNKPVLIIQDIPPSLARPTTVERVAEKYGKR